MDAARYDLRPTVPVAQVEYCDDSGSHLDWLEGLGFAVKRSYYPGKAVIQPGTEGLMFTGNEKVWPYRELARVAPRGHKGAGAR